MGISRGRSISVLRNMTKYKVYICRVLIFLLYLWSTQVDRSAPQTSKTTWAVCCSPGNALQGGLWPCSELRIQIRLLFSYSPLSPALQGEVALVRGGNCLSHVIYLDSSELCFPVSAQTAKCSRLQRWRHELCLLFMGFVLTLPVRSTHSLSIFFFFLLIFFWVKLHWFFALIPTHSHAAFWEGLWKNPQGLTTTLNLTHPDCFRGWSPFP